MATFKVGQRVRIVNTDGKAGLDSWMTDAETVVTSERLYAYGRPFYCTALTDNPPQKPAPDGVWESHLIPLTDPGAERFIERIKRLGKEPVNEVKKERA